MENLRIDAGIKNLKNILVNDEKFYQIPDYQRPYSWDKDNISDLIDDLVNAYERNPEENYFCGSIVLVENKNDKRYDVIDGQQRLTTFTIIACVFREIFREKVGGKARKFITNSIQDEFDETKRKLKILINEKYQIDFESEVLKKIDFLESRQIEKALKGNRYLANANYTKIFLEERLEPNTDINDFVEWFYENVVLAVINCPNQDSAIQIFNVLNDRGMPLSSIDILKSSLMVKLDKEDMNAFKSKWEQIISNLEFASLDLDSMLNTYLYYKLASNPKNRLDKELSVIFKKENKSSLEIIREISDFSDAYIQMSTLQNKDVYCLRYLRHKIYWSAILSTAIFEKYESIDELIELLVSYYYQNWIAGKTVARIKQTSFNILKLIKSNQDIEKIREEIKSNLESYGTTKTFREELESSYVYGRRWDRALLLLVEYFSTDNSKMDFIELGPKLHLEHILPQTKNSYWSNLFTNEQAEKWTNSLANLTLLSLRKNVQAQNYSFNDKKHAYGNRDNVVSSFIITQDILKETIWNQETLQRRHNSLIEKINRKLIIK